MTLGSRGMTPAQFIAKWSPVDLPERAASQEHFLDLCRLLGQPTPAEYDATGAEYTFEKGVAVAGAASATSKGEYGFADVWWRGKFGWEYKRKGKYRTLDDAYRQLCQYREALENPPLLVVCDIARTIIHTNFTGTKKEVHELALADFAQPKVLDKLRRVFTDPDSLRPGLTTAKITEIAAAEFAKIADNLRQRRHDPQVAAHFLMKCMFCLFAEDVELLEDHLFSKLLKRGQADPDKLTARLTDLFQTMRAGGDFGTIEVAWFNGGLFDEASALPLTALDVRYMLNAATSDWSAVEPAIFGTLFERLLDPDKRAQIGAHYTSRDDILLIVEPVVMAPLRRRWAAVQAQVETLLAKRRAAAEKPAARRKADAAIHKCLEQFADELAALRILDPACGSGNFLYVAIQQLLALEKEVITLASRRDIGMPLLPRVRPTQLHGLELNPYAAELAQVVIWIGYLQWMKENGFGAPRDPILAPLNTIECRDAIIDLSIPTKPRPAAWPTADFIIGNPPFLGTKMLRGALGDSYVDALFSAYEGRIPGFSDLCCYWFELAREHIQRVPAARCGLLATQAIRNDAARTVLERIKESGDIFYAWSDREWVLEGAHVHVAMVGFDTGLEESRLLDGLPVGRINADLSAGADLTIAVVIPESRQCAFVGDVKGGPFDVAHGQAVKLLSEPCPNGRCALEVVRPYTNGLDVTRRHRSVWIVDFGSDMSLENAAPYGAPFEYVAKHVKPARQAGKPTRSEWWLHMRPCPSMREAIEPLARYLATPTLTKHRLFIWMSGHTLPDHQLVVFARSDDYFFGVLHSAIHELWALRKGTQLEDRPRYTPTTCFETFPLPWPPGQEPTDAGAAGHAVWQRISTAAAALNEQRERWLNPPEWVADYGRMIDGRDTFADVPAAARPLLRWSALMAEAARHPEWKKRTLTNLYNERPTWLRLAHAELDRAVLAAYALVDPAGGWDESWAEVWTETGAGQPLPPEHARAAQRAEIDQRVLANLLRLNLARAAR